MYFSCVFTYQSIESDGWVTGSHPVFS